MHPRRSVMFSLIVSALLHLSSIAHFSILYESLGLSSFRHCFHHPAFLPPPLPCLAYSPSVSIQHTVTMLSVFFWAGVENKTALYPSSCKPGTALTSSEKPDSQTDRQAGTNRVNLWITRQLKGPGCQFVTREPGLLVTRTGLIGHQVKATISRAFQMLSQRTKQQVSWSLAQSVTYSESSQLPVMLLVNKW